MPDVRDEELSFFERIITQSAGDEALLLEYIRSKAYELRWVYAHWYDEYVSRTTHNNQPPLGVKIMKVSRYANCIRCIIFYELPAY